MEEVKICSRCKHYREKRIVNPFSSKIHAWTSETLKLKAKWEQEQNEIAMLEQQKFEAGEEFDYEPNYFPWCIRWTEKEDRHTIDPVTGAKSSIYVLCATKNNEGQCQLFEQSDD